MAGDLGRGLLCASSVAFVLAACSDPPPVAVRSVDRSGTTVIVRLPDDWPSPIYPQTPTVVVEDAAGNEIVAVPVNDSTMRLTLPEPGAYRFGASTGDDDCLDTAGVAQGGNPPIEVADGDDIQLIDTGEICD